MVIIDIQTYEVLETSDIYLNVVYILFCVWVFFGFVLGWAPFFVNVEAHSAAHAHVCYNHHANKTLKHRVAHTRCLQSCEKSNNRQGKKRGRRSGVARSVEFTEAKCNVSEVISAAKGQLSELSGSRL